MIQKVCNRKMDEINEKFVDSLEIRNIIEGERKGGLEKITK